MRTTIITLAVLAVTGAQFLFGASFARNFIDAAPAETARVEAPLPDWATDRLRPAWDESQIERVALEWTNVTRPAKTTAETTAETAAQSQGARQLARIRQMVREGKNDEARRAMKAYNTACYEEGPVFLFNDPALAKRNLAVHPSYAYGSTFAARLKLVGDRDQRANVLVPPGASIRAPGKFQDVAILEPSMLQASARPADIVRVACCEFGDDDPRGSRPAGLDNKADPKIAKVTVAAAELGVPWETTQVAVWAITNDVDRASLYAAPGAYRAHNVAQARTVLAHAGLDASKFQLWSSAGASSNAAQAPNNPFQALRSFGRGG